MHRKRTRFAARVHKVATALERRGVVATYELHDRVLANRVARLRHSRERPELDDVQTDILRRLRDEGYAVLPFTELVHDPETLCFICGPAALVDEMPKQLRELGIPAARIRIEEWGPPASST